MSHSDAKHLPTRDINTDVAMLSVNLTLVTSITHFLMSAVAMKIISVNLSNVIKTALHNYQTKLVFFYNIELKTMSIYVKAI